MCGDCAVQLNISVNFKDQCLKSEEQLRLALLSTEEEESDQNTASTNEDNYNDAKETLITVESNEEAVQYDDTDVECNDTTVEDINEDKLLTEDNKEKNKFECNICDKTFRLASGLKVHLIKHGKKLKCKVCKEEFTCKSVL